MLEPSQEEQRFFEQLPEYVNGLLSATDQAWMEQYIRDNPHAEAEVEFDRKLMSSINSTVSPIPMEEALAQSLAMAEKEGLLKPSGRMLHNGSEPPTVRPPVDSNICWWGRLWQPFPIPAPILATLVAAVVAPALWVAQLGDTPAPDASNPSYRGVTPSPGMPCTQQHRLRLVFGKQARVEEVSLLLGSLGADVVSGPTVNGEFWVRLSTAAALQKAMESLKAQAWVDDVWTPPVDSTLGCR